MNPSRILLILIAVIILYPVFLFVLSYYNLNRILTNRVYPYDDSPEEHGLIYEKVTFKSEDGLTLSGWVLPAEKPKGLIMLLHGFGVPPGNNEKGASTTGGKSRILQEVEFLIRGGYSVFVFDFRLQGESEGEKITFGKDEVKDVQAARNFIESRQDLRQLPQGLMGISFGGAMSLLYAPDDKKIKALVTTSSYENLNEQFAREVKVSQFGFLPLIQPISRTSFSFLLGKSLEDLSPEKYIGNIKIPILIVHGGKDERIPPSEAQSLYEKANEPKTLVMEPNSFHGILSLNKGPDNEKEDYKRKVIEFLDQNLK